MALIHQPCYYRIYLLLLPFILASTAGFAADPENLDRGKYLFNQCKACHSLTAADRPRLGPTLNNLFQRQAGTQPNYTYSAALQEANFAWTEAELEKWLEKPNTFLPGNKMPYAGMRNAQDRKDLIAYLRHATVPEPDNQ